MRFVVYLWWVSVSIVGIRSGVLSSERVCNAAVEIIFVKWVVAGCVYHEGGVVCRAEEFPVGCKGFSFSFHLNLDGLDFL